MRVRKYKRRSKLFWKDLTIAVVGLLLVLFAMIMAGVLRTIKAQEATSATITDCKVTKADDMIHVKCGDVVRTMPKAHWPKAWQYAEGEHPENLPPRPQTQPTVGQTVKMIVVDDEFIAVEPCAVRVNMRVRARMKSNPGELVSFTFFEPPPDCRKPPRPLDFYQIQEILKRRQEEHQ